MSKSNTFKTLLVAGLFAQGLLLQAAAQTNVGTDTASKPSPNQQTTSQNEMGRGGRARTPDHIRAFEKATTVEEVFRLQAQFIRAILKSAALRAKTLNNSFNMVDQAVNESVEASSAALAPALLVEEAVVTKPSAPSTK